MIDRLKGILKSELNHLLENGLNLDDFFNKKDYDFEEESTSFSGDSSEGFSANQNTTYPDAKYYEALEIPYGSSLDVIKTNYRKLIKVYHPDLYVSNEENYKIAVAVTKKINEAYQFLKEKHK